jgi:hypothetical protein
MNNADGVEKCRHPPAYWPPLGVLGARQQAAGATGARTMNNLCIDGEEVRVHLLAGMIGDRK